MRLRSFRIMPGAVAIKFAAGTLDIAQQKIDFDLHAGRGLSARSRRQQESEQQHRTQGRALVHSSLSSGSSDKRSTLNRSKSLRAGSVSYSTALPSSSVRQTRRGGLPRSRETSASA